MKKIIRLAALAAALFLLPGCIAWRSGPYDYDFRVPIGDGTYKCCRTENIKVGGMPLVVKKTESGLPMASVSFKSGEELAGALGDKGKLNATAEEFVEAINKYHNVGLNEESLPAYLKGLEVVSCPEKEKYVLSSVVVSGKRHLGEIEREFKEGEMCFKDRNTQIVIGSADCGNIGKPAAAIKGVAAAKYKEVKVCRICEGPPRYSFGGTVSWGHPGGYYGGYTSSYSAPVIGGGAPTVTVPTSMPGPAPAAPSKIGGAPAPAYKSR